MLVLHTVTASAKKTLNSKVKDYRFSFHWIERLFAWLIGLWVWQEMQQKSKIVIDCGPSNCDCLASLAREPWTIDSERADPKLLTTGLNGKCVLVQGRNWINTFYTFLHSFTHVWQPWLVYLYGPESRNRTVLGLKSPLMLMIEILVQLHWRSANGFDLNSRFSSSGHCHTSEKATSLNVFISFPAVSGLQGIPRSTPRLR